MFLYLAATLIFVRIFISMFLSIDQRGFDSRSRHSKSLSYLDISTYFTAVLSTTDACLVGAVILPPVLA